MIKNENSVLWRTLGAALLSLTGSFACAADTVTVGGQLGGALISSEFSGDGSSAYHLQHGAGTSFGAFGAYNSQARGHAFRWVAQTDYAAWDNADAIDLLGGVDYVWKAADGKGGVYLGPRVGAFHFADDLTDDSSTVVAYGVETGFLTPLSSVGPAFDDLQFGLFLRQLFMGVKNEGTVNGGSLERDVELDSQTTLGVQLLWTL